MSPRHDATVVDRSSSFTPLRCSPKMGQMVCGHCEKLSSYPRDAKKVQCPWCQTINFVLEAHQAGTVKCGKCSQLLLYPYGAQFVKCYNCNWNTKIEEHNKRPPQSNLQGQPAWCPNPALQASSHKFVK